jgi:hypothetical protein
LTAMHSDRDPNHAPSDHADLELRIGAETPVELKQLVSVSKVFAALIGDVAEAYTGRRHGVRWLVEIERGSVRLPLKPQPANKDVRSASMPGLVSAIATGITQLEREPRCPEYFNDSALLHTRALAKLLDDSLPLSVRNGGEPTTLTPRLLANVETVLGKSRFSLGSVEGKLEALNIHDGERFSIYSPLYAAAVPCKFGRYLKLDDVLPAVGKRVAVRGRLRTRPNGERISIEAHSLRILGENAAQASDVLGILKGCEEGEW